MKVAVAKYPVEMPRDFAAFAAKQHALLAEAKRGGAELAVLPNTLRLNWPRDSRQPSAAISLRRWPRCNPCRQPGMRSTTIWRASLTCSSRLAPS